MSKPSAQSLTWDEWEIIIHVAEATVLEYPEQIDQFLTILADLRDQYLENRPYPEGWFSEMVNKARKNE